MIRKGLLLSLIPLAIIVALSAWGYAGADPGGRFPVHWGLNGQPDRYGSRAEALLGLPLLAIGLSLLMAGVPRLDPRGANLHRSAPAYLTAWLGALCLLALVQAGVTLTALGLWEAGPDSPFPRLLAAGVALLIALVGNVLGKARPNWVLGVRTPWTLSSDLAWERTHRLAGRLFVAVGAAGLIAALALPPAHALVGLVAGVLAVSLGAAAYSYAVWRSAPDQRPGPQVEAS